MGGKLHEAVARDDMDDTICHGIYAAIIKLDKYHALAKANHSWILATGMHSPLICALH
jgi:hypothetical protein